jgi:hypothetical protein
MNIQAGRYKYLQLSNFCILDDKRPKLPTFSRQLPLQINVGFTGAAVSNAKKPS